MLKIIHTASDQALATRIVSDFRQGAYEIGDNAVDHGDTAILVLSPAALNDMALQAELIRALDLSVHLVPVMAQIVQLPKLIDHLDVVDFSTGYDFPLLRRQVDVELAPDAPLPVLALTPKVKRSNRRAGLVVALAALVMFAAGLYAVGVLGIQAPIQEFNNDFTALALTRDLIAAPELEIYAQFLPRSTEDAANYAATLRAVPTVYRPLVALTATAVAQGTLLPAETEAPVP
ncbi:MAG: hypothetical protein ABI835_18045 [Chloroflexota bacterium]